MRLYQTRSITFVIGIKPKKNHCAKMCVCFLVIETAGLIKPIRMKKTWTEHCWSVVRAWSARGKGELWRGKGKFCRGKGKLCRGPKYPQNQPKS